MPSTVCLSSKARHIQIELLDIQQNRQSFLACLLRAAQKLSEAPEQDIAKWGGRLLKEPGRLAQMSEKGPTRGRLAGLGDADEVSALPAEKSG